MSEETKLLKEVLEQLERLSGDLAIVQSDVDDIRQAVEKPKGASASRNPDRAQRAEGDLGTTSRDW